MQESISLVPAIALGKCLLRDASPCQVIYPQVLHRMHQSPFKDLKGEISVLGKLILSDGSTNHHAKFCVEENSDSLGMKL